MKSNQLDKLIEVVDSVFQKKVDNIKIAFDERMSRIETQMSMVVKSYEAIIKTLNVTHTDFKDLVAQSNGEIKLFAQSNGEIKKEINEIKMILRGDEAWQKIGICEEVRSLKKWKKTVMIPLYVIGTGILGLLIEKIWLILMGG